MPEQKIRIEKLCYGGAGLGRIEGKACFVPFSAPGDEVAVTVAREKKSYMEAGLSSIVVPAPCRVEPPCPIFGDCGGCNWQHVSYQEQLAQKTEIFADTLRRLGGIEGEVVLPTVGSQRQYGYRSRIQLKLATRGSETYLGFFRGSSHEVVDAPMGCAISDKPLNDAALELRKVISRLPERVGVTGIDIATGSDGATIAILHGSAASEGGLADALLKAREELPSVTGLFLRGGARKVFGIEELSYTVPQGFLPALPETSLSFARGGFSQVNYGQNLQLLRTVWEWGAFTGSERLLDLYCGNGNFSVPLARYVAEVIGVEGHAPSVADARKNAQRNGIGNATFMVLDAAKAVRRFLSEEENFDLIILDPPRSGAAGAAEIAGLGAPTIIYVSCDPPTLARDLRILSDNGYTVERSQPVDMFPQTYHLESATLLKRRH
ncbi:23S rRNA (uracil(1939)-C(5))-methyltransferase RlmD [Geomonas sp. RF6]|uniref:23S rRNA (uracil(1939)-C(5))-methyltransferase RlmD n=1 Tax=Geomonas sp. RF6 TaxID=2897342 RepID=UPI001E3FD559|nr:23S rRNA (uracil(1939)-C(5))-methyltransferase RlmD [Geomonas sp. RF6]UFS70046.1 23S rRNA (uracil(1939)-C(5))-methyltransferase RlmD [Geomonas sp. RF6]